MYINITIKALDPYEKSSSRAPWPVSQLFQNSRNLLFSHCTNGDMPNNTPVSMASPTTKKAERNKKMKCALLKMKVFRLGKKNAEQKNGQFSRSRLC